MRNMRLRNFLIGACAAVLWFILAPLDAMAQKAAGAHSPTAPSASASSAAAQQSTAAPTPAKATLADMAWLEGRWRGDWGPRIAEQVWTGPKAGVMTGVFRLVENDNALVIELFTIVEKPEGLSFYLRHFTPELVTWEKAEPTVLNLTSLDPKRVDFENPVNGLPKHAILLRVDADTYTARSELVPEAGEPQVIEITYQRQKPVVEKPSPGRKK
jgi:hypothetical protein